MNIYHYYGSSDKIVDSVCWVKEPWYNLIFGLIPMAISIVLVGCLNSYIIYMIASAFGNTATDSNLIHNPTTNTNANGSNTSYSNSNSDANTKSMKDSLSGYFNTNCSTIGIKTNTTNITTHIHTSINDITDKLLEPLQPCITTVALFTRLSPRSKHAFFRLVAIPISFVILALPGITRRILIMTGTEPGNLHILSIITLMLATSGGTVNALIWLVTDDVVLNDWKSVLMVLCEGLSAVVTCDYEKIEYIWNKHVFYCHERRNSSFSGPESEYSDSIDGNGDVDGLGLGLDGSVDNDTAIEYGIIDDINEAE